MKINALARTSALAACIGGLWILPPLISQGAVITQTINNTNAVNNTNWNGALWGTPAASPTAGNVYVTPAGWTLRTPFVSTNWSALTFAGDSLTNAGILLIKHGNWPAVANLTLLSGASIQHGQGPTSPATTNSPLAGTLTVAGNATISAPNGAGPRHVWLQTTLHGSGGLTVSLFTNVLFLSGNASAYSGNWTVNGGRLEVWSGIASPLGSGNVTLVGTTNSLTFNSADNLLVNNEIGGNGSVIKRNSGEVLLHAYNTYSGGTFITNGVLKLGASGAIPNSAGIHLEAGGVLDVSAISGFMLGSQYLRGRGTVLGDLSTSSGTTVLVGFAGQYGQLNLSNNLTLWGGETLTFDLGAATNDVLNVAGSLTLNSAHTIEINLPEGFVPAGTYRLINYSGTLQGFGFFSLSAPSGTRQTFLLDTATPGQVNLVVSGSPASLVWSGDGIANTWDVGSSMNWNGNTEPFYNMDSVTFNDTGSATPQIDVSQPVRPASMTVSNTAKNFTFSRPSAGGITCSGPLIKLGTGMLTLANNGNDFSGSISINEGTLSIGDGNGIQGTIGGGRITNNGALVLNKFYSDDLSTRGGAVYANVISGTGSVRVTGGGHTPYLSGANSYSGPTVVEGNSALYVRNNSALGSTSSGTTVQAGARFGFTGGSVDYTLPEPLILNGVGFAAVGAGALWGNDARTHTFTGPITIASPTLIRHTSATKFVFSNTVTAAEQPLVCSAENFSGRHWFWNNVILGNTASLTKMGPGYMTLGGATNAFGSLVVSNGYVVIASPNPLQVAEVIVNDGTLGGEANPNGSFLHIGDGGMGGAFPTAAQIKLAGGNATLVLNSTNHLTLTNQVVGEGRMTLLTNTAVTITANNSFAGNVVAGSSTSSGGKINLRHSHALGDGSVAKNVSLYRSELQLQDNLDLPTALAVRIAGYSGLSNPGAGLVPVRSLSGNNSIGSDITVLTGGGHGEISCESGQLTIHGGVVLDAGVSSRELILSGTNGVGRIKGAIADGDAGRLGVVKKGAGNWTLDVGGSYTGDTVVEQGVLSLGAGTVSILSTNIQLYGGGVLDVSAMPGGLNLAAYQNLSGSGTVQGNVTAAGTVSPGTSVGVLAISGNLALFGTTVMELNRANTPNADLLTAVSIAFGGTLTVANIGPELQAGDTFNLFDGNLSGAFALTNLPALSSPDLSWDTSLLNSEGVLRVAGSVAPPPTIMPLTLSNGNLVLQLQSTAGFSYVVEASPTVSPASWTGIQTNAGGGVLTFTIPVDPGNPQRFFRVRVQ